VVRVALGSDPQSAATTVSASRRVLRCVLIIAALSQFIEMWKRRPLSVPELLAKYPRVRWQLSRWMH